MKNDIAKIWNRNAVLIIFVGVTILGLLLKYTTNEDSFIWELWSTVDVSLAVSLGVMAFLGYREYISLEDEISIYFEREGIEIDTGLTILRKNFTRGELMGILGMIQQDQQAKYSLAYLKNKEILHFIHAIQKGEKSRFVLPLSDTEIEQFVI